MKVKFPKLKLMKIGCSIVTSLFRLCLAVGLMTATDADSFLTYSRNLALWGKKEIKKKKKRKWGGGGAW